MIARTPLAPPSRDLRAATTERPADGADDGFYQTKTPYRPQQDASSYEAIPSGYLPISTQLVARHGSRGLANLKYDGALHAMLLKAEADGALTGLGRQLLADTLTLMRANALLGHDMAGVAKPGYGNLTRAGIREHQGLAGRLLQRMSPLFGGTRAVRVIHSGKGRAVDSARHFADALVAARPALAASIAPATTDRFLLYFHALKADTDLVTDPHDPRYATWRDSLAYQAHSAAPAIGAKLAALHASPEANEVARAVLATLVTPGFAAKLGGDGYRFANLGRHTFTAPDTGFSNTVQGDGRTTLRSAVDAVHLLYNLLLVAPALTAETRGVAMETYLAAPHARYLAYLRDAADFYRNGPGIREANPVTYRVATILLDDFFTQVEASTRDASSPAATLRFTHGEEIMAFASRLQLDGVFVPEPAARTYAYDTNPWRGSRVSPMAANLQWDVFGNGAHRIVRMLYNERETDFPAACDGARIAPGSHFYDYDGLRAAYGCR
ncbi:histidine-type phosphatase [Burkholderia plantarii]|uniref:histidine-type phosphatase n=1 Tax=Burkholderia plantarii TaxID=41899 RepID=UPI0018DE51B3|nr:histidine-type phosphatase [Burkholderia plantarii]MBI0329788.1 histidine-type phosphatase [Burkholderia plantarii]